MKRETKIWILSTLVLILFLDSIMDPDGVWWFRFVSYGSAAFALGKIVGESK